jgi:hypothetical protein
LLSNCEHLVIQTHTSLQLDILPQENDQAKLVFTFSDDPSLDNNDPCSPTIDAIPNFVNELEDHDMKMV